MSILIDKKKWLLIASKTDWELPRQIKTAQSALTVDLQAVPVSIPSTVRRAINIALGNIGNYHKFIPLTEINSILEKNGCIMIQEDGTKWAGFIAPTGYCGETNKDGSSKNHPMQFDLAIKDKDGKYHLAKSVLVLSACKMPSEKIEIVAYIS